MPKARHRVSALSGSMKRVAPETSPPSCRSPMSSMARKRPTRTAYGCGGREAGSHGGANRRGSAGGGGVLHLESRLDLAAVPTFAPFFSDQGGAHEHSRI